MGYNWKGKGKQVKLVSQTAGQPIPKIMTTQHFF